MFVDVVDSAERIIACIVHAIDAKQQLMVLLRIGP